MTSPASPPDGSGPDDAPDAETLSVITALYREHAPRWAVWAPSRPSGQWVAVRVAGSRSPGPGLPLAWAEAPTAEELSARMRRTDSSLRPEQR